MRKIGGNLRLGPAAQFGFALWLTTIFILATPIRLCYGGHDSNRSSEAKLDAKESLDAQNNGTNKLTYEGKSVAEWKKQLEVPATKVLLDAIEALRELYPASEAAISGLREALLDENEEVSVKAADLLRRFSPGQVVTVAELVGVLMEEEAIIDTKSLVEKRGCYPLLRVGGDDNRPLYYVSRFEAAMYLGRKKNRKVGLAIAALEQVKDDKDPAVRFHTAVALWRLCSEGKSPVPLLKKTLSEKDREVRFWAAHALVEAAGAEGRAAIPVLLDFIGDPEGLYHGDAFVKLLNFGPEIMPAFLEKLELPWDNSADAVADTLYMKLGEERSTEWLMGALKDKRAKVRRRALDILGVMRPRRETALAVLAELLADENVEVRRKAVSGLGNLTLPRKEGVRLLTRALKDEDTWVRSAATYALGNGLRDGEEEVLAVLIEALKDRDVDVRVAGIRTLGNPVAGGAKDVAGAMVKALKDKETRVRLEAAKALVYSDVESAAVVPILVEMLSDESKDVRRDAAHLLGRIGPAAETAIGALREALKDEDKKVRCSALVAVVDIIDEPSVTLPTVIQALRDKDAWVRNGAAMTLAGMGPSANRATSALIAALHDESEEVRGSAAYALGKINSGGGQSTEALISALKDRDWVVRKLAAEALGAIGDRRAVEALVVTLKDKDQEGDVRHSASKALGRMGDLRAAESLLDTALDDVDPGVRKCAASALRQILQANRPATVP